MQNPECEGNPQFEFSDHFPPKDNIIIFFGGWHSHEVSGVYSGAVDS